LSRKQVCRKVPRVRIPPPPPSSVTITLMDVLRKLALGILSPLFITLLFATAFDVGFVRTATHPAAVKQIISESGLYDSLVPNVLRQTKSIETPVGSFSTSDPAIAKAANQAVTPQYIKQNAESAIDNIYQWLDGKVAQPTFKFDLSGPKNSLADSVAALTQQRLSGLPACTNAQSLQILQSGQLDVNSINCLPKGVTPESAAAQVKASVASAGTLDDIDLSAASIKGSDNQPVFQQKGIKDVPKQYRRAKKTPLILSALTILAGAGIVFLSKTWQKGLRHVGINLVVIGVVMLAFSYVINRAVSTKVVPKIRVDNAIFQQDIRNLVTDLTQRVDKNYWFFGGLYTVVGAGSIAAAEFFHRKNQGTQKPAAAQSGTRFGRGV
jgi:hypothetical protein